MLTIPFWQAGENVTTSGVWKATFGNDTVDFGSYVNIPYENRKTFTIPLTGVTCTVWTEVSIIYNELYVYISFEPSDAAPGQTFTPTQSAIGQEYLIPAILLIIGLGVGALFLKSLEKVVNNPAIEILLIIGAGAALIYGFKYLSNAVK